MTGIVVDSPEAGARYAISEENFDPKTMTKVRDLKPGETVIGYAPKSLPVHSADDDSAPTEDTPAEGTELEAPAYSFPTAPVNLDENPEGDGDDENDSSEDVK